MWTLEKPWQDGTDLTIKSFNFLVHVEMKLLYNTMQTDLLLPKQNKCSKKVKKLLNIVPNPIKRLKAGHGEEGNSK